MIFQDREEAGRELAERLKEYKKDNPIVLALPRGGVVVGYEIAKVLNAPLGVVVVRKLSPPSNPEYGIGAIAEDNVDIWDRVSIDLLNLSAKDLKLIKEKEKKELNKRLKLYKGFDLTKKVKGKIVILVDDGLATGVTAQAAIEAVKKHNPKMVIFAIPACAYETAEVIRNQIDSLICIAEPQDFWSVGTWYVYFEQVSDEKVLDLLKRARENYIRGHRDLRNFYSKGE